jgi:hypothetical protein
MTAVHARRAVRVAVVVVVAGVAAAAVVVAAVVVVAAAVTATDPGVRARWAHTHG